MFLLRAVDNRNAFVAATFNKQSAKEQLTYPLNSPTSVFEVEDVAMADRISVIHGMSFKAQPEDLDYILLPVDLVRGFGLEIIANPTSIDHPLLIATHREIMGLNDPETLDRFCEEISQRGVFTQRLKKKAVKDLATREATDPDGGLFVKAIVAGRPKWDFVNAHGP